MSSPVRRPGGITIRAKQRAKPLSRSKRADLTMPVSRIHTILRRGNFAPRVGTTTAVYLAAILEYLVAEILELACDAAKQNNRKMLSPRHILLAVRNDNELDELLDHAVISQGGVMPRIAPQLLPKKTSKKQQDTSSQEY